jgi:hypothetical protein
VDVSGALATAVESRVPTPRRPCITGPLVLVLATALHSSPRPTAAPAAGNLKLFKTGPYGRSGAVYFCAV